ncbi:MAG: hypothetical protein ACYCW6_06470 [Candidatus Xenobia bacterium]
MSLPPRPMKLDPVFLAGIPQVFLDWYARNFASPRRIYGHWSGSFYGKVFDGYHQCIAMEADNLDEMVRRLVDARERRIGGSLESYFQQVLELKDEAQVKIYENAPLDKELRYHTPKRTEGSIAICLLCGHQASPRNLGFVEPLPDQIQAFLEQLASICLDTRIPVENFMTHSEAADNLDYPAMDDPSAPHPPYGYRTKREVWDLEFWIEPWTAQIYPPEQVASGAMLRFADYVRQQVLALICETTRPMWEKGEDLPAARPAEETPIPAEAPAENGQEAS